MGRGMREARRLLMATALLGSLVATGVVSAGCGGGDKKKKNLQTVRFQAPTSPGPDPFTPPADTTGPDNVRLPAGTFGGTGSDLVCDRERLIASLRTRPDRLVAWAQVVKIGTSFDTVARYIRELRPVTLTRDTRVTNHSFVGTSANAFQAILAAGTAVLIDSHGEPRARCRCGNPLTIAIFIPEATCVDCPPNYSPPPPCVPFSRCFTPYPHPPEVETVPTAPPSAPPPQQPTTTESQTPAPTQQAESPSAFFTPRQGGPTDTYTLHASGFRPNTTLRVSLTRPDGVTENYSLQTGGDGSGSYRFPYTGRTPIPGTYTAVVRNPNTGASTSASTEVSGGAESN